MAETSEKWNSRTLTLLGEDGVSRLTMARVLVVGVGGVGGYAAEMLARSGIGHLTIIDADCVAPSNINRQLIALQSNIGEPKVELFANRFRDINPDIEISARQEFLTPENVGGILDAGFDYVIDAIDTVAPKVALVAECLRRRIRIISSMGAGGRIDPTKIEVTDLWKTREDGLARALRQRLKQQGLRMSLRVVASNEAPRRRSRIDVETTNKRTSFGTLATVPATFGIFLAAHVVNSLFSEQRIANREEQMIDGEFYGGYFEIKVR